LGKSLQEILEPLELSVDEFIKICDQFTNKKLFVKDANGRLVKDRFGNLTKLNDDNLNWSRYLTLHRSANLNLYSIATHWY